MENNVEPIAENMPEKKNEQIELFPLLDALEDIVDNGMSIPMGKCVVKKEDFLEIVRKLRLQIPEDIKNAVRLVEERDSILKKAELESQRIIKEADIKFDEIVDEHEIISAAYKKANEIVNQAQLNAREVRESAYEYVGGLLDRASALLRETVDTMAANRREIDNYNNE